MWVIKVFFYWPTFFIYQQGVIGKYQDLSLASTCWLNPGTIEHEFLHALGLFHTQNRFDRDNYVQIIWQNVQGGPANKNFWKYSPFESNYFGLPYNYLSVMHYRETDGSKNGGITIQTRDQRFQKIIGKSPGVSRGDVRLIKKMYHCN